ncbi:MAG TPA: GH25 family lysozyme [Pseudonocardiaceae bacterium]|nr:GH25 family lysozyme [Pseudonocardiaceae bacterium]
MLGIDLYQKYNLVTDWHLVAQDGVKEVYVKLTDGGGQAAVHGDTYVAAARAAGMKVGGYHFMQPSPAPETQADVFAAELRRLHALDIAPALDLEAASIPAGQRAGYGQRFLRHLAATLNIHKVALYSSASWLADLKPATWNIPGLLTWAAQYGANDGRQHPITAYTGHVDAHQYTSAGHLPGISGDVDLDDILTDITESTPAPTPAPVRKVDDMAVITGDWPAGTDQKHKLICPVGTASTLTAKAWFSLATGWSAGATGHVWFIGTSGTAAHYLHDETWTLAMDARKWWALPDGTDQVSVEFTSTTPIGWAVETQPK